MIAVVDTGIYYKHEAFQKKKNDDFIRIENFVAEDKGVGVKELSAGSHGTMVAYIAGGDKFGNHPCGVAPNATLLICRVGLHQAKLKTEAVIEALSFLKTEKENGRAENLHVVCMAFGIPEDQKYDDEQKKIAELINDLTNNHQVICVASCGNYGLHERILFPACLPNVICVGALDRKGGRLKSNNVAVKSDIDAFAIGEKVVSPSIEFKKGVISHDGSSCATPAVAGLIALIVQDKKKKKVVPTFQEVKETLTSMKDDDRDTLNPYDYFTQQRTRRSKRVNIA